MIDYESPTLFPNTINTSAMNNIELRHVRYFVAVAEELHFGRAAVRLQIAQQPLSAQIRRLENELGVVLFRRTTRRVELTEAGRVFLQKAQQTLQSAEEAVTAAREVQRGERGQLTLGYINTTLYNVLPGLVRAYREAFPNMDVTLRELCSPELDELVVQGKLDVGLVGTVFNPHELEQLPLWTEPFVVVLPTDHPLAALPEVPLAKLADEPFIQYDRMQKRQVYDTIVHFFHHAGIPLNIVQEASSEQALIGLAAAGIGLAVVSASVADARRTEVVYRRLTEPAVDVVFNLIWHRDTESPAVQSFVRLAHSHTVKRT